MASKLGKLDECTRCGETIFLEKTGTGSADGGYTRWDNFEPLPKEWLNSSYGTFCPVCAGIFVQKMRDFFGMYEKLPKEIRNYKEEENNDGECVSESSTEDC